MTVYAKMWKMMEEFKFKIDSELSIDLKCIICNNLLIDACQGPCGCLYCKGCIEKALNDDLKYCPGESFNCKIKDDIMLEIGINIIKDNNANRRISKLKYECPLNSCVYKCELGDMCEHLRVCDKRETMCPFSEVGCRILSIHKDKLNDHFNNDIYQHSKLLNEWIMHIKNEMASLINKLNHDEALNEELPMLKDQIAQIIIDNANAYLKNQIIIEEMRKQLVNFRNKNNENEKCIKKIKTEMNKKNKEIDKLKLTNKEIDQLKLINIEVDNLKATVKELCVTNQTLQMEIKELKNHSDSSIWEEKKIKTFMEFEECPNDNLITSVVENDLKLIVYLEWVINDVGLLRKKRLRKFNDDIYSVDKQYKMRLLFDSFSNYNGSQMSVRLFVYDGLDTALALWPFHCKANIMIKDKKEPDCYKEISHCITINKPANLLNDPIFFYFNIQELKDAGVFQSGSIIIDCAIYNVC